MPCTQWKLPGCRNPKAEPDHLHYTCDTGEKRSPRNRLLPSLREDSIHPPDHTKLGKVWRRSKPRGSLRRCIRIPTAVIHSHSIAIIPQFVSCVSTLMKKFSFSSCLCSKNTHLLSTP